MYVCMYVICTNDCMYVYIDDVSNVFVIFRISFYFSFTIYIAFSPEVSISKCEYPGKSYFKLNMAFSATSQIN